MAYLSYALLTIFIISCDSDHSLKEADNKLEHTERIFQAKTPSETGIIFQNTITSTPKLNILNYIYFYNGAGVAAADFNNDGLPDLYFSANQTDDKLYLNLGDLKFKDITIEAGINNSKNWTTGVTTVDINADGLLDIYISKVGAYHDISGKNLLYINEGFNDQGIPAFTENAAAYNLDFKGLSTQASFFDYDLDGDLDMFLLNHATNPNQNYGKGSARNIPNEESGDKLFENNGGVFVNVSEKAGILQSKIGYGLGLSISDLNNDGFPDIYVGNDFFENDYLYLNNGDKTFTEIISQKTGAIGHTTHYSMGNDIADLNNDGYADIVSVDMLPEDLSTYKTSGSEFNFQIYNNYLKNGYAHQFMQNTLQLNNGNGSFSEIAYQSGIAASEWSWSPLIADFDNDGYQDIYITNGILGATNDMDFISFIANDEIQKNLGQGMKEKDMNFISKIPEKKTINYFFRNKGNNQFEDSSSYWMTSEPSFSNGATYSDLDNDGDLDIVTNNVNQPAFVLENTGKKLNNLYLKIKLKGSAQNPFGIGAKVILYLNDQKLSKENYTTRGYLSAVAPELHFGLGNVDRIDSLHIVWPNRSYQTLKDVNPNQEITGYFEDAKGDYYNELQQKAVQFLTSVPPLFDFKHKENPTIDFNRNPLIPFAMSNEGPDISVDDVNNDGLQDVFIGGAKGQASQLFIQQKDGSFVTRQAELFARDAINEDVGHVFFDANGDAYKDLLVVSGGNEFTNGRPISPRLYLNDKGVLRKDSLFVGLDWPINASRVKAFDLNEDGYTDAIVTSNDPSSSDGNRPSQLIFQNTSNKNLILSSSLVGPQIVDKGRCNDILNIDIDGDGIKELITAGDWAPISVYGKVGDEFVLQNNNGLENTNGWWNRIKAADFDNDGDIDLIAGNWGLNSRLKASEKTPMTLYTRDFDNNDTEEHLVTYFYKGVETPFVSKDELVKQLPHINKKYLSYADFASASLEDIFGKEQLRSAIKEQVFELASCYFENTGNGKFKKHPLPSAAQISSVNDIHVEDFNKDGYPDLLLAGNNFEISPQLSSLDASHGVLLLNDSRGGFQEAKGQIFDISGAARTIEKIRYQGENYLIVTRNNDHPLFFKINP